MNTPNMFLPLGTVGQTPGPTWALDVNGAFTIVDQHNHSNGSGVQINPSGLNINSSLPFNNNFLTGVGGTTYAPLSSTPADYTTYTEGVDLYFVDGNGNAIQLTSGGVVNATSSGIASGTASAAFSGGVLVVNAASNTPANIQGGSLLLGNNTSGSKFLTLAPPASMGANFTLTLPNIPSTNPSFMTMDTSGNMGTTISTSGGITGSMIASATIARSNLTSPGLVQNTASNYSVTGTTWTNTGIGVGITTTGNPVLIVITIPEAYAGHSGTGVVGMNIGYGVNGTFLQQMNAASAYDSVGSLSYDFPMSCSAFYVNGAGYYIFNIYLRSSSSAVTAQISDAVLSAYEIK